VGTCVPVSPWTGLKGSTPAGFGRRGLKRPDNATERLEHWFLAQPRPRVRGFVGVGGTQCGTLGGPFLAGRAARRLASPKNGGAVPCVAAVQRLKEPPAPIVQGDGRPCHPCTRCAYLENRAGTARQTAGCDCSPTAPGIRRDLNLLLSAPGDDPPDPAARLRCGRLHLVGPGIERTTSNRAKRAHWPGVTAITRNHEGHGSRDHLSELRIRRGAAQRRRKDSPPPEETWNVEEVSVGRRWHPDPHPRPAPASVRESVDARVAAAHPAHRGRYEGDGGETQGLAQSFPGAAAVDGPEETASGPGGADRLSPPMLPIDEAQESGTAGTATVVAHDAEIAPWLSSIARPVNANCRTSAVEGRDPAVLGIGKWDIVDSREPSGSGSGPASPAEQEQSSPRTRRVPLFDRAVDDGVAQGRRDEARDIDVSRNPLRDDMRCSVGARRAETKEEGDEAQSGEPQAPHDETLLRRSAQGPFRGLLGPKQIELALELLSQWVPEPTARNASWISWWRS